MNQERTIEEYIRLYLLNLQLRNCSIRTIETYGYNLGFLVRFLEEKKIASIKEITTPVLSEFREWFFYLPTKRGTARGVRDQNTVLSGVKGFCGFLESEEHLTTNPSEGIEFAKEPRRLPKNILTPKEAKKIIESVDISHPRGYRDRTILEVFYATGIRKNELRHLRLNDVNLEEEILKVNCGKGGYDRVIPLSRVACRFLETYIKGIRPQLLCGRNTDFLFLSWRGKQIDPRTLTDIVKNHAKLAKVNKNVTCHLWRHTTATHLLKNEAKLRHVQAILGHRSLATTEKYLHLTITDLKQAHKRYHPREKS
jgi:integrase/recombinase XerD